jgi:transcription elongation factor Elf1
MPEKNLPDIIPCTLCNTDMQIMESMKPIGRTEEVWRITCRSCGFTFLRWAVSKNAAVRRWNQYMKEYSSEKEPFVSRRIKTKHD